MLCNLWLFWKGQKVKWEADSRMSRRVWKERLINCILIKYCILWFDSGENCYGGMCLKVWICLSSYWRKRVWSQSCFIMHLSFPLFPLMFGLGSLVSSFGQHISSWQSSDFSFSALCLYTTRSTKNKSRNLLASGLQEQWQTWIIEWMRSSKERQLLATKNMRCLCVKEVSDL